jgi:hypothetical protein
VGLLKGQTDPGHPVVLDRKKNGDLLFSVDYRKLNITKKDFFLLLRIDDNLDTSAVAK